MLKKKMTICAVWVLYIACIVPLVLTSCKMKIETETEIKQRVQKEEEEQQRKEAQEKAAAIHLGDSVFIKCVKGYWVVTYAGGGAFQLFETVDYTKIPQPVTCEK